MKVQIEIDCTPAEARAFLGLPDVAPLNEAMVAEAVARGGSGNLAAIAPGVAEALLGEELLLPATTAW